MAELPAEAPLIQDAVAELHALDEVVKLADDLVGNDQIVPPGMGLDPLCQVAQGFDGAVLAASQIAAGEPSRKRRCASRRADWPMPEPKGGGELLLGQIAESTAQAAGGEGIAPGVRADIDRRRGQLDHHESTAPLALREALRSSVSGPKFRE